MQPYRFLSATTAEGVKPNMWDWIALPLVLGIVLLLAWGAAQMSAPYQVGAALPISLDPSNLPYYLMRTTIRMLLAMACALLFSIGVAFLAAKNRQAEKAIIPALDILQSIPILGFLSITVTGFIALFPGNLLGVECAAIFAIFTSQVWNMTFSLYQSLKTIPADLDEAATMFHLSLWQRFWQLELPFAMPGLLWNAMMSMSGGWFFVVASEAITVNGQEINLPGIGSYIALAIKQQALGAVLWAVLAMALGILLYDQLLFRPLVAWADRFRFEQTNSEVVPDSWVLRLLSRAPLVQALIVLPVGRLWDWITPRFRLRHDGTAHRTQLKLPQRMVDIGWNSVLMLLSAYATLQIGHFIFSETSWSEIANVFGLGLLTLLRVFVLTIVASLIWVPIGVKIGMNPHLALKVQALAQFMAAFPANLLFPLAVIVIVYWDLNPNIWLSPLIILGTQWYILFNVVAGASGIPSELREAATNFGLKGWLRWKRFLLPGIFPSYVTGAVTATGGSWNASIVAEMVSWGNTTLRAEGLGCYIAEMTAKGDFPRIALGIAMMVFFVVCVNRLVWRRLYRLAETRLRI